MDPWKLLIKRLSIKWIENYNFKEHDNIYFNNNFIIYIALCIFLLFITKS